MKLANVLKTDHIAPDLESRGHWDAIYELLEKLSEMEGFSDDFQSELKESFKQREDHFSTGIGNGVAIPHTFSNKITEPKIIFGRSLNGLDFDAVDDQPVTFVVMFITPEEEYQLHLHILAAIGKAFRNPQTTQDIMSANSSEEIVEILKRKV